MITTRRLTILGRRMALAGGLALAVVACGSDAEPTSTAADEPPATQPAQDDVTAAQDDAEADDAGATADAPAGVATTDLGEILVDANGFSLYGFTADADGTPTCEGGCADAWPPVVVDSGELPAGLDATIFSVVQHPDGRFQLKAGDWPLYRFAGDIQPGDTNGQESGGVWFVAAPDGSLIGA